MGLIYLTEIHQMSVTLLDLPWRQSPTEDQNQLLINFWIYSPHRYRKLQATESDTEKEKYTRILIKFNERITSRIEFTCCYSYWKSTTPIIASYQNFSITKILLIEHFTFDDRFYFLNTKSPNYFTMNIYVIEGNQIPRIRSRQDDGKKEISSTFREKKKKKKSR